MVEPGGDGLLKRRIPEEIKPSDIDAATRARLGIAPEDVIRNTVIRPGTDGKRYGVIVIERAGRSAQEAADTIIVDINDNNRMQLVKPHEPSSAEPELPAGAVYDEADGVMLPEKHQPPLSRQTIFLEHVGSPLPKDWPEPPPPVGDSKSRQTIFLEPEVIVKPTNRPEPPPPVTAAEEHIEPFDRPKGTSIQEYLATMPKPSRNEIVTGVGIARALELGSVSAPLEQFQKDLTGYIARIEAAKLLIDERRLTLSFQRISFFDVHYKKIWQEEYNLVNEVRPFFNDIIATLKDPARTSQLVAFIVNWSNQANELAIGYEAYAKSLERALPPPQTAFNAALETNGPTLEPESKEDDYPEIDPDTEDVPMPAQVFADTQSKPAPESHRRTLLAIALGAMVVTYTVTDFLVGGPLKNRFDAHVAEMREKAALQPEPYSRTEKVVKPTTPAPKKEEPKPAEVKVEAKPDEELIKSLKPTDEANIFIRDSIKGYYLKTDNEIIFYPTDTKFQSQKHTIGTNPDLWIQTTPKERTDVLAAYCGGAKFAQTINGADIYRGGKHKGTYLAASGAFIYLPAAGESFLPQQIAIGADPADNSNWVQIPPDQVLAIKTQYLIN